MRPDFGIEGDQALSAVHDLRSVGWEQVGMATFITQDGRRIPFLDWVSAACAPSPEKKALRVERDVLEELGRLRPQLIAANDLLDRNLLAFIQC